MTRHSVLRSGALRLAFVFATLFVGGAVLYVGAVHYAVQRYARTSLESAIETEISIARGEDMTHGRTALVRHFENNRQSFFNLFDRAGARVAGTLPPNATQMGWHTVALPNVGTADDPEDEHVDVLTRGMLLDDGSLLVVGRSLFATEELVEWLDQTALWTGAGIVILALGGGWLIAAVFLRRLDGVSDAIDRIMSGAFAERIPPIGMGAEFDKLAAQLNGMLDRIFSLMERHRQLSTNIAHDLRTPLTRVHQRLELTRDGFASPDARDAVDGAIRELDEVLSTFGALLRLGTIETGALRARFQPVDIAALLRRVQTAFAPVAEDQGKTLVATMPHDATIVGDAELLMQLFSNLIENALLHSGKGTNIDIELRADPGDVVITVADDGPGIPATERTNVFQRFYRLDRSRPITGVGLGLALAEAIVVLHRGSIVLSDNSPGLKVTVRCPVRSQ